MIRFIIYLRWLIITRRPWEHWFKGYKSLIWFKCYWLLIVQWLGAGSSRFWEWAAGFLGCLWPELGLHLVPCWRWLQSHYDPMESGLNRRKRLVKYNLQTRFFNRFALLLPQHLLTEASIILLFRPEKDPTNCGSLSPTSPLNVDVKYKPKRLPLTEKTYFLI